MRRRLKNSRQVENGAQLVELMIVLPILLVLLAATAEFGRYFYTYTTLSKATRAGARYLSGAVYTSGEKANTRRMVVCGNFTDCSDNEKILSDLSYALPGSGGNVEITETGGTILPQTITVSIVNYEYHSLFNLGDWVNVNVGASTTMRYMLTN